MPADRSRAHGRPRGRAAPSRTQGAGGVPANEMLVRAERMLLVSDLVGGLVHELNNPLGVVIGQSHLLRDRLTGSREAVAVERLARAAERCAQIGRSFAIVAREEPPEPRWVALNPLVEETLSLFAYAFCTAEVLVERELDAGVPGLLADPREVRLLVANLLAGALRAVRAGSPPRILRVITRCHPKTRSPVLDVDHNGPRLLPVREAGVLSPPPQKATAAGPPSLFLADHIARSLGARLTTEGTTKTFARVEFAKRR